MTTDNALIADIYRSIGDKSPFTTALDLLAHRYGAKASSIIMNDVAEPIVSGLFLGTLYQNPDIATLIAEFMQKFGADEQVVIQKIGAQSERFRFVSEEDGYGLSADEIPATLWNRKQLGVDRRYAARLSLTPAWFDVFSFHFPVGHKGLNQETASDSKDYMLHISTALELARPFRLLQVRFNAVSAALDKLKIGVALVTGKGEVVLKNNRIEDILQQQDGISLNRAGRLEFSATDDDEKARFSKSLMEQCTGLFPSDDRNKFLFTRLSGKIGYVADLSPIGPLIAGSPGASKMAVLIIKDPNSEDQISVDAMQRLCNLTEAETDISAMLVNGQTINEVAEERSVHRTTARNQVASIFEKTGSNSQSQLIRFALSIDLPVEKSNGK